MIRPTQLSASFLPVSSFILPSSKESSNFNFSIVIFLYFSFCLYYFLFIFVELWLKNTNKVIIMIIIIIIVIVIIIITMIIIIIIVIIWNLWVTHLFYWYMYLKPLIRRNVEIKNWDLEGSLRRSSCKYIKLSELLQKTPTLVLFFWCNCGLCVRGLQFY